MQVDIGFKHTLTNGGSVSDAVDEVLSSIGQAATLLNELGLSANVTIFVPSESTEHQQYKIRAKAEDLKQGRIIFKFMPFKAIVDHK